MELVPVNEMAPEAWDEAIKPYDFRFLFHTSAWLRFLEETQGGVSVRFRLEEGGALQGYFAGLLVRKGPLKVLGSPLPGWTTYYLGPIVNQGFDSNAFLEALSRYCREHGICHAEICSPAMDPDAMQKNGFIPEADNTYMVPLCEDEERMWANMKSECRNRIRKGIRNGLVVEENFSKEFAREFYDELLEVFGKQGLVPSYPRERVLSLMRHLGPESLFALQVRHGDQVVATGLFPHDDRCLYFFGGASWIRFHHLCPNELLHWTAMKMAAKLGIQEYNMCGEGSFKPKFGARKVPVNRYSQSYTFSAKLGRNAYRYVFYTKQKIWGKINRLGHAYPR